MSKIKDTLINDQIKASKVRLVNYEGEFVGLIDIKEALKQAEKAGVDLVAVDYRSAVPVCKILDYGKMKYSLKRKHQREKKASKKIIYKEIQMTPHIEEHDYNQKMNSIRSFIDSDYRVKIVIRARGRVAPNAMSNMLKKVLSDIEDFAKLEGKINDSNHRNIPVMIMKKQIG